MIIPARITRIWNLREVDVSRRVLRDEERKYLVPVVEQISLEVKFSHEFEGTHDDDLFDVSELSMYAEARATHAELIAEMRKAVDKFNTKMLEHAAHQDKHTVFLLTKETTKIHKREASPPPAADFDVQSITSTVKTKNTKRVLPITSWMAGVR